MTALVNPTRVAIGEPETCARYRYTMLKKFSTIFRAAVEDQALEVSMLRLLLLASEELTLSVCESLSVFVCSQAIYLYVTT